MKMLIETNLLFRIYAYLRNGGLNYILLAEYLNATLKEDVIESRIIFSIFLRQFNFGSDTYIKATLEEEL